MEDKTPIDDIKLTEITFTKTKSPFGWLGNMSPYPVTDEDGLQWRTTEALFQAMRFAKDDPIREEIRAEKSPMGAKSKAKSNASKMVVKQLSDEDVDNMKYCIQLKIRQHSILKEMLIDSNDLPIYEDVSNRGRRGSNLFWGALKLEDGSWEGNNILGKLFMDLRKELTTPIEIERRFLLNDLPDIAYDNIISISQHYLSEKGDNVSERIRLESIFNTETYKEIKRHTHTIKEKVGDFSFKEDEKELDIKEYFNLQKNALRGLTKKRHTIEDSGLNWEIDDYSGKLVIMEVELPSEDYDLKIPEWLQQYIIMEVTGMKELSNSNLAK